MPTDAPVPPLAALRLWDDRGPAGTGAWNMAVDEALLGWAHEAGEAVMRVYRWDRPTLSFGYFMEEAQSRATLDKDEVMIRRWTGGGLVHHGGTFTWTLVVPHGHPLCRLRPAKSYLELHEALGRGLDKTGFGPVSVVAAEAPAPMGGLCAEAPAPGDVLLNGRKIAGAGQRRTRHGLLHQGVLFLPESALPGDFPEQLAGALAAAVRPVTPEWGKHIPLAKYTDPHWNARR